MTDPFNVSLSIAGRRRTAVAVGGAIGAAMRGATLEMAGVWGLEEFWATSFVNVAGSFALGVLVAWHTRQSRSSPLVVPFVGVGVFGGFTTFSLFSVEVFALVRLGDWWTAAAYSLGTIAIGLGAAFAGVRLGRRR